MAKLGSIELVSNKDVKKGEQVSIRSLFSHEERWKEFEISSDIDSGETKIRVNVLGGALEINADTTKEKGEKISLGMLIPYLDLSKEFSVSEDVKKDKKTMVSVELI